MKRELIAYAAGLFDGEGYIGTASHKSPNGITVFQIRAGISMTDHTALVKMAKWFGGSVYYGGTRPNPRHKPLHQWTVCSRLAASFLKMVYPFLLIKRDEAKVAIKFQTHLDKWNYRSGHGTRVRFRKNRTAIFAYRHHLIARLRQLKLRVKPLAT